MVISLLLLVALVVSRAPGQKRFSSVQRIYFQNIRYSFQNFIQRIIFSTLHPLTMRRSAFCALLMLRHAAGFHEHHSPSRIPTPTPTHDPTPTWEPTIKPNPSAAPTPAPTINDPGVIEKIWFTFVDVDRLDVRVYLSSFRRWLELESLTGMPVSLMRRSNGRCRLAMTTKDFGSRNMKSKCGSCARM